MNNYSDAVTRIVDDYLERVQEQLCSVPLHERNEFLKEIRSHLFESYQQTSGSDDVARILQVLRNMGEPAEVASERLPASVQQNGTKWKILLYVLAGVLVAMIGIPLGLGSVAVLAGILIALTGVLVACYASAVAAFSAAAVFMALGLIRSYQPEVWDRLIVNGMIEMDRQFAVLLDTFSPVGQASLMMSTSCILAIVGLGMLWLGSRMKRVVRSVYVLESNGVRKLGNGAWKTIQRRNGEVFQAIKASMLWSTLKHYRET